MSDSAIRCDALARAFGEVDAVNGVDLDIARGEIYGFLGPNGAGKSTTVRMLCTLLAPTSGRASVAGFDVVEQPGAVRLRIGVALQEAALDPRQTGTELLLLQGRLYGLSRADARRRVDELGELIDLSDALNRRIGTYSGGMKRRLDLALALIHAPSILFLDEPTTGLDPQSRTALWEEVGRLAREEGVTVFLTTQYLEEADVLADRVGIIDHGKIVADGSPTELKASVGRPTVEVIPADPAERDRAGAIISRFGEPCGSADGVAVRLASGETDLAEIVRALDAEHLKVEHLQLHQPSLDDVFLTKTGRTLEGAQEEEQEQASRGLAMEPA